MNLKIRLPLTLLLCFTVHFTFGQKYMVHKKKTSYFGLTAGFNFSAPKVTDRYSILSAIGSADDDNFKKKYDKLGKNTGTQFGVRYAYNFTNSLSFLAGFGYQSLGFKYFTHYSWMDTIGNQNLNREMHHLQKISYLTLPLMLKWEMGNQQLLPYIQGGFFMDFRHQAKKVINYDNTIDEEETENQISSSAMVSITDHIRKFNMGLIGGIGVNYYTKRMTFGIESNFNYGFLKVIDDKNRFSDFTGFALHYLDVMDQLKLSNLNIQLTVSIPINNAVSLNILRKRKY